MIAWAGLRTGLIAASLEGARLSTIKLSFCGSVIAGHFARQPEPGEAGGLGPQPNRTGILCSVLALAPQPRGLRSDDMERLQRATGVLRTPEAIETS